MSDGKLRLNLAALRLKSFETTPHPSVLRGTVVGMDDDSCSACTFCTNSCSAMTWCIGTCGGPTNCNNASVTDSGCAVSDGCEPPETYYCTDMETCH